MIGRVAAAVTGRRGRLLTIAVWIALAIAGLFARAQIGDVTAAGESSFLPTKAESTRAVDALQRSYGGGEDVPVELVFVRRGGLTEADLNAIGRIGEGLEKLRLTGASPIVDPFSAQARGPLGDVARIAHGVGPISRDGEAALVVLAIDAADRNAIAAGVERIRAYLDVHAAPAWPPTSPGRGE